MTDVPNHVTVTDVVLRDGLQDEDVAVPTGTKVALAKGLLRAGLPALEVGAFVNPARVPQMADTGDVLAGLADIGAGAALHTLVFTRSGAERAVAAGARHVRFVVSASDGHSRANAGAGVEAALDRLDAAAEVLAAAGTATEATIATAFVCPFDGPTAAGRVAAVARRLRAAGGGRVHLADTIGRAHPGQVRATVAAVREECPDLPLGLHLHNTYNLGLANAWAALRLGVSHFDASLGGIGGCPFAPGAAGNIGTDDLVNLLHSECVGTGIDPEALAAVRDDVAAAVGRALPSALATVGARPASPPATTRNGDGEGRVGAVRAT